MPLADAGSAWFLLAEKAMIIYVAPRGEAFTLTNWLEVRGGALRDRIRLKTYEELEGARRLEAGAWIFSGLDRVTPAQRQLAELAWTALESAGPAARPLNRPGRVLLRAPLLEALHRSGVNRFKAVPPSQRLTDLSFPVFVRERDAHTGSLTRLLPDRRALEGALGRLLLRGFRDQDLLIVEFMDTSDESGLFRKFSSYYVDGEVIPKAIRFGREWMLKARHSFWDEAKVREQQDWFDRNDWAEDVASVFRLARIDYGRMDYAVADGGIQVWEINTNPTLGRGTGINKPAAMHAMRVERAAVSDRFDALFRRAVLALEPDVGAEESIPFDPPPSLLTRIGAERAARARHLRRIARRTALYGRLARLRPAGLAAVEGISRRLARLAL